jgi:hypothetical protein
MKQCSCISRQMLFQTLIISCSINLLTFDPIIYSENNYFHIVHAKKTAERRCTGQLLITLLFHSLAQRYQLIPMIGSVPYTVFDSHSISQPIGSYHLKDKYLSSGQLTSSLSNKFHD